MPESELTLDRTTTYVSKVVFALLANEARIATKFVSPTIIVRATRRLYKHNKNQIRKNDPVEIVLTIKKPNYHEREFIKQCKKAEEPFPVKNILLKFPPKKKKQ